MAFAKVKDVTIDFSDMSGGCNGIEHQTRLFKNQISDDSIGFALKKSGLIKQQGSIGLSSSTTFIDYIRGMFSHKLYSGTENLYSVSRGKLYKVSTSDGSITQKYDMGNQLNEAWACDSHGKKFVCNGDSVIKIEDETAYQVGITAPAGASAVASAGAGLADGDYEIYVSYARKVDGVNSLYSQGESLGTVTLGTGNNQITVTIPTSSDAQVNNKVVWIKSPSEAIHYFFYETDDNTTVTMVISSDSAKETAIIYEYAAADNGLPPALPFIFSFAGRLWGYIDNTFYYSNDGTFSVYNLEIWAAANYRVIAHKITGIFSVGLNLYFNTEDGIIVLPYADINQKEYLIERRWHFENMRTVDSWNNGVIGLTNQGVRLFDGDKFTSFDFGYPIRNKINKCYNSDDNFKPCGFVYRRDYRDEYHLMWQDQSVSVGVNNTHAVLNLSSVIWENSSGYSLAWEFERISGNYAVVFKSNNTLYIGQSHGYTSKIYYKSSITSKVNDVFDSEGALISSETDQQSYVKSRYHVEDISGMMKLNKFYCHAQNGYPFEIRLCSGDGDGKKSDWKTIPKSGGGKVAFPVAFPLSFGSNEAAVSTNKVQDGFWCRSAYVEIRQTANDINFKLLQLIIFGRFERNNFT